MLKSLATSLAMLFAVACATTPPPAPAPSAPPVAAAEKAPEPKPPYSEPLPESEAWRMELPKGSAPRAVVLPAFQSAVLKNGLTVMVPVERSKIPIVGFLLVTRGGATFDPPESPGAASMAYGMLNEGAGERDALKFADALADLGAEFAAAADRNRGSVSVGGLARNADAMVALLADAVGRPRFRAADFERRRSQQLASMVAARGSPQGIAFEILPKLIYGEKHPYGHPPSGTLESLRALKLSDIESVYQRMVTPERSALIAAGDIDLAQATKLAEKHLGKWKGTGDGKPAIPMIEPSERASILMIDKKPSPQTMVIFARPMPARGAPEDQALSVMNEVFGGAFSSRINMNLREAKGYTYGAGSQLALRLGVGVFMTYAAVRSDVTGASLQEFAKELTGMSSNPPTVEEVSDAKAGIVRGLPGEFERTMAALTAASSIFVYDLAPNHFQTLPGKYEAVTPDEVAALAAKYLDPARMHILLVGDAAETSAQVEGAKLGELDVRPAP